LANAAWVSFGFTPAFDWQDVAAEECAQWNGAAKSQASAESLRCVLGFEGNARKNLWSAGRVARGTGEETTFSYLIVLARPVEVGTVMLDPVDDKYRGSVNNGEMYVLKETVTGAPDPFKENQWTKVEWAPVRPFIRVGVLPPKTKTRAFLVRDVRIDGESRVEHWRAFKERMWNMLPEGMGTSLVVGTVPGETPAALTEGGCWCTRGSGHKVAKESPADLFLEWDVPREVSGVYLRGVAAGVEVAVLDNAAKGPPALIKDEKAWATVGTDSAGSVLNPFDGWAFRVFFLKLQKPATTRAVRLRFSGLEQGSPDLWTFAAVFEALGARPVPKVAQASAEPPFEVKCAVKEGGLVTAVLNDAKGNRVRNLFALKECQPGEQSIAWDLRDPSGEYVKPGTYKLSGIAGPALDLYYQMTPYPNVHQLWPDRTPWLQGHAGVHGWLSDHCQNWAVATIGDELYFGAPMAEAGVALIATDLDGKKSWGKHDFGAWQGVDQLTADARHVYVLGTDKHLYQFDPATKRERKLGPVFTAPDRKGYATCLAAYNGEVYVGFTGARKLDNAVTGEDMDWEHCYPKPANNGNLARAMRLEGPPPGQDGMPGRKEPQGNGNLYLESGMTAKDDSYWMVTFKRPLPIGSVVFPHPGGALEIGILKADAAYPPDPGSDAAWQPLALAPVKGQWSVATVAEQALVRAVRVKFSRGPETPAGEWYARMEGIRFLRCRFANASESAKVTVSSGAVAPDGSWDAQRTQSLGRDAPGIYMMTWDKPQALSGLAIKEVDGEVTEIDVWQGPVPPGGVKMDGPAHEKLSAETGWRNVTAYTQRRRSAYTPAWEMNKYALYLDDMAEFGEVVTTPAVRMRVVQQWMDHGDKGAECRQHDGRSEHGMHYTQSYTMKLDTRLCGLKGVAALTPLGGEVPVDEMQYERITVFDGETGAVKRELPTQVGWHGLSFNAKGELFANNRAHDAIIKVDPQTGASTPVVKGGHPSIFAVGPVDGLLYVSPGEKTERYGQIIVYDPATGKEVRAFGGGKQGVGAKWKPDAMMDVFRMAVDKNGSLWVVEMQYLQRRILQFNAADGKFVKEILGNTLYGGGGGGAINRYGGNTAWYDRLEFSLDWAAKKSAPRGLLAEQNIGDCIAVRPAGQKQVYLASTPAAMDPTQSHAVVYTYDEATGTAKMVAAVGSAELFRPLRAGPVISKLEGATPGAYEFVWSDTNGNGVVDADEVSFTKPERRMRGVGRPDSRLGFTGSGTHYQVARFLPNGVPVYERKPVAATPVLALDNGNYFSLGASVEGREGTWNRVTDAQGNEVWSYPAHNGISGLDLQAFSPGNVAHQFAVIGHERAASADIGEFFVVHSNSGEWNVWTADGLLCSQVFLHKFHPRASFIGPKTVAAGDKMPPLTTSQEHFHGFFARVEPAGNYYAIAGFDNMSIFEVRGIDRLKRFSQNITVTEKDLQRVQAWDSTRRQKEAQSQMRAFTVRQAQAAPAIDGERKDGEWPGTVAISANTQFSMTFDASNLYLMWHQSLAWPTFKNDGSEWRRLFKTGAAADFQIGIDPAAPGNRKTPAKGDMRILIANVDDKPKVVLYQPVAPGAAAGEAWRTRTVAGGETTFDRVTDITAQVQSAVKVGTDKVVVEAAIPLSLLGWTPRAGQQLRMDCGFLTTTDGHQVKQRMYWSNTSSTGTSDEAIEARLEPCLWGYLLVE